jgi:hypothetical protein
VSGEAVPASTGLEDVVNVNFIVSLVQENKNNTDNKRMNFFIATKLKKKYIIIMDIETVFNHCLGYKTILHLPRIYMRS